MAAATVLFSAEVSAFLRVELLFCLQTHTHARTHTETARQGSSCAVLGFKGTELRATVHTHTHQTEAYAMRDVSARPGIP